ncbi:hypothetical protein CCMA1212_001765 [Trichoderma ghanense]|uniref:Uncharacterized protein n=1 Tax=Trichoderma ghanense TaxID=65468 RepID=A0ABY2HG25_9HYPO
MPKFSPPLHVLRMYVENPDDDTIRCLSDGYGYGMPMALRTQPQLSCVPPESCASLAKDPGGSRAALDVVTRRFRAVFRFVSSIPVIVPLASLHWMPVDARNWPPPFAFGCLAASTLDVAADDCQLSTPTFCLFCQSAGQSSPPLGSGGDRPCRMRMAILISHAVD